LNTEFTEICEQPSFSATIYELHTGVTVCSLAASELIIMKDAHEGSDA
jgi:hypothetical protein